jgi:hypothetical protein
MRRRFVRGRELMELQEIFDRDVRLRDVSFETMCRVFDALGKSFRLNPQLIRPSDRVKDLLVVDSWSLWGGKERMETWLYENCDLKKETADVDTVMDLLLLAQRRLR